MQPVVALHDLAGNDPATGAVPSALASVVLGVWIAVAIAIAARGALAVVRAWWRQPARGLAYHAPFLVLLVPPAFVAWVVYCNQAPAGPRPTHHELLDKDRKRIARVVTDALAGSYQLGEHAPPIPMVIATPVYAVLRAGDAIVAAAWIVEDGTLDPLATAIYRMRRGKKIDTVEVTFAHDVPRVVAAAAHLATDTVRVKVAHGDPDRVVDPSPR